MQLRPIRSYEDLTKDQQKEAREICFNYLMEEIETGVRFDDAKNESPIQQHIDKAVKKAESLQTPWFLRELLVEDTWLCAKLQEFALAAAKEAIYPIDEQVIYLTGKTEQ